MPLIKIDDDNWIYFGDNASWAHTVNGVAAYILSLVDQGHDINYITSKLVNRYDVSNSVAKNDTKRVLDCIESSPASRTDEAVEYEPITDFTPDRPLVIAGQFEFYLPGICIRFHYEEIALLEYFKELFPMSSNGVSSGKVLDVNVFSDGAHFPIVFQGITLDTGLTLSDTAIKCLREVSGIVAKELSNPISFHASAVSYNDTAVLFPAVGGSGKTTLAAYLMSKDFRLLNDDAVTLSTTTGCLYPVPICLSIKSGSFAVLKDIYPSLINLKHYGLPESPIRYLPPPTEWICTSATPCSVVVFPQYSPKVEFQVETVSLTQGIDRIINNSCVLDVPLDPVQLNALVDWMRSLQIYHVVYNDMEKVRLWLLSRFES